jgi:hypothetical protein
VSRKRIGSWLVTLSDPAGLRPSLPERRLRERELAALCDLADAHGVLPAVAANLGEAAAGQGPGRIVEVAAGRRAASEEVKAALAAAERRMLREKVAVTLLRRQAEEIGAALSARSLTAAILKGPDFAERLYPRTTLRLYKDLDVLVPLRIVPDVEEVLGGLGYGPVKGPPRRASAPVERVWRPPEGRGGTVDVRWNLSHRDLSHRVSVRFEDLEFEERRASDGLLRPTPSALLLIAAAHAATPHTFSRLQSLWDTCQAARGVAGPICPQWVAQAAARTGTGIALAVALRLGRDALGDAACGAILERLGEQCLHRGTRVTVPAGLWAGLVTPRCAIWPGSPTGKARRLLFRWLWRRA